MIPRLPSPPERTTRMDIAFADKDFAFIPWTPSLGAVFSVPYAFDSETTLIDDTNLHTTPDYVLGAAFDGEKGYFILPQYLGAFLAAHPQQAIVMHHAPFDLRVINKLVPALDVYGRVEANLVWDTRLLHRLYALAAEGHTARGTDQSTLEHCAEVYLGLCLPKDTVDSQGHVVRKSYGQWFNCPPSEIEPVYLEYLARDVVTTLLLFQHIWSLLQDRLGACGAEFGFVSPEWLTEQCRCWGLQTHHIQLKGAIVLDDVSANGLRVNVERCQTLLTQCREEQDTWLLKLQELGWQPGPGSATAMQKILRAIEGRHPEATLPRTKSGRYTTSAKALGRLQLSEQFIEAHTQYAAAKKKIEFLEKMARPVLHPRFDPLMVTGRSSSSGDLNSQNLPREEAIRQCFEPSPGHTFIDADYKTVELATLAQSCISQFNQPSKMAETINAGEDLHAIVAAKVTGKPIDKITKEERQRAKAVNFGKPGGMGNEALRQYAEDSYGVVLADADVAHLSEAWFELFPEMRPFLESSNEEDVGEAVATMFGLTPEGYAQSQTLPSPSYCDDSWGDNRLKPGILGWMLLKTARDSVPATNGGRAYTAEEIDYFWTCLQRHKHLLPSKYHAAIEGRRPSENLRQAILRTATDRGVFTLTGRLRANASYTERHNTVFQGLAADGAKLALWRLWRKDYRLVNFIHDEVLVEVPANADLTSAGEEIKKIMIEAMKLVVPDVRIDAEVVVKTCWSKEARLTLDNTGELIPRQPSHQELALADNIFAHPTATVGWNHPAEPS